MKSWCQFCTCIIAAVCVVLGEPQAFADDWPMLGRDNTRNAVSPEKGAPTDWRIGEFDRKTGKRLLDNSRNIKWIARLGNSCIAQPVVSNGLIWIGSNNSNPEFPDSRVDMATLLCFRERDGKLLYRYARPRHAGGRSVDYPYSPIGCSPLVESDRLWFFTSHGEVACWDISPLHRGTGEPVELWKFELRKNLGVNVHAEIMFFERRCSIASYKHWIYVITNHGVQGQRSNVLPNPKAPSLVCFDKNSGEVVWTDNSPGENILCCQPASPLVSEIAGRAQVIAPMGDGWLRSFDPRGDSSGGAKLLWEFDMNPKESKWAYGRGTRNNILSTPVLYNDRVYLGNGMQPNEREGPGRLVCLDPTKEGDISAELAVDEKGRPLTHRRLQAVDRGNGEKAIANPNSGLVWEFTEVDENADGEIDFEEAFNRTVSNVAIKDDLLIAVDHSGLVHCFDAATGERHWKYDTLAAVTASPLIVGDKVYVADEDGMVAVFNLAADLKQAMKETKIDAEGFSPINVSENGTILDMGSSVYASPIFANGTLYVASRSHLFSIQDSDDDAAREEKPDLAHKLGFWPQWRGPNRDNVSTDTKLLKEWPDNGPPLLWRAEGLGEGIASVSIADGRVFTLGYRDQQEYVTAVSAATGEQLWMTAIGPAVAENRLMRWLGQRTPAVDGERLYAVRSDGDLVCLRVADGRELWRKSYTKDFGTRGRGWGICDYPLVDGEKLICSPGGVEATIVALNKKNGEVVWKTSVGDKEPSSYVATIVSEGGGIRQYVTFLRKGLVSVAADDGRVLWRYEKLAAPFANSVTPIVRGDSILSYNGYGSGRALLKLVPDGDGVKLQEQYFHRGFLDPFQDSTLWVGEDVHTFRQRGILDRYNARTGERITLAKRIGRGISSMTYADGHIIMRKSEGGVSLIEATTDDYVEKSHFEIPDHELAMGATNPVVTGGRLWLRDDNRLFCYDVRETALDRPTRPALITLRPSESKNVPNTPNRQPRSVFVPTPQDVVETMLELAEVKKSDVVYDLGSGDGRIVITAAKKYECKALGYEIDKELVEMSRERVKEAGVEQRVKIEQRDIFTVDLRQADVIAVYLLPKQLEALIPQLAKLKPGSRIVSHHFEIPGITTDKTIELKSEEDGSRHKIHLWTAPLKKN